MPQKKSSRRLITPLLLFSLAGWALWALGRNEPARAGRPGDPGLDATPERTAAPAPSRATWSKRRLATSLAFVTLFFAGAALSAGAGDVVVEALEGTTSTETTTTTTEEEPAAEEAPVEEEAPAEGDEPASEQPASEEPAPGEGGGAEEEPAEQPADGGQSEGGGQPSEPSEPSEPEAPGEPGGGSPDGGEGTPSGGDDGGSDSPPVPPHLDEGTSAPTSSPEAPVLGDGPDGPAELDPEADAEGFFATVWLHRTLPDPTPPAKRLTPAFARRLALEAKRAQVSWALVLGVLRASGQNGSQPASAAYVGRLSRQLAALGARRDGWRAVLALRGDTTFADRAVALTRYNRAVGLTALVSGLEAAKPALQKKVLADKRLNVYPGGRLDVAMGRTDIRVLVLLEYLAEAHKQVTVSSLTTGHRLYARPGVVSAHVYGLAVDVAALENKSIAGNQGPDSLTEEAVRNILLLPAELQPRQVISLLGLGGPSFPMANHWDHIHVGY
jgi:hypothetical protein